MWKIYQCEEVIAIDTHDTYINLCQCCVWYDSCNSFQRNKKTDIGLEKDSVYLYYELDSRCEFFDPAVDPDDLGLVELDGRWVEAAEAFISNILSEIDEGGI